MDRTKLDLSKWKIIIRKCLGKVCQKNALQIALDVLSVDAGLKPSYLFDVACVSGEKLQGFIEELHQEEMIGNKLLVLVVEDDVFVIHPSICDILQKLMDGVQIVDVSETLPDPVVLPKDNAGEITSLISKQLQECLGHRSESHMLTLSFPAQVNFSTVFGYLLGYPVLYWSNGGSAENCLSMVPLLNFKIEFKNLVKETTFEYTCFSFSVPKNVCMAHKIDKVVDLWYAQLKESCSGMFENPVLSQSEITLPSVAM